MYSHYMATRGMVAALAGSASCEYGSRDEPPVGETPARHRRMSRHALDLAARDSRTRGIEGETPSRWYAVQYYLITLNTI